MLTRWLSLLTVAVSVCLLIETAHAQGEGQSLGIASVPNLRDLGGYATAEHARVRDQVLYRSNQLAPISPQDRERIAALGLRSDFDLRTQEERAAHPDELPPEVADVWLNVLADEQTASSATLGTLLRNPSEANRRLTAHWGAVRRRHSWNRPIGIL
jgi:protein-tyrosine phosphatase